MKKIIIFAVFVFLQFEADLQAQTKPRADDITIELARVFSRDIFELNGVPYLQPLVQGMNATSNSAFFSTAYVPHKVDKPYFKISLVGMMGIVPENKKIYKPQLPAAEFSVEELSKYVKFTLNPPGISEIIDTVGLIHYAFKVYTNQGVVSGGINPPDTAPTVLGYGKSVFHLPRSVYDSLIKTYPVILGKPLFEYLSDSLQQKLLSVISQFPEYFTLPEGADLNTLIVGIPQFEIGSWMGTELLVRIIPPINWGETIGDFGFWSFGIKHSISQYFPERWFDLAIQGVYQGTYLKNQIGVTNADLVANGNIWSGNLQASKHFKDAFDIYAGISYDLININSNYAFVLPQDVQIQLGLLEIKQVGTDPDGNPIWEVQPPSEEYPGDTVVQNVNLVLRDYQIKGTVGFAMQFNWFRFFVEYNFGKFDVLAAGLQFIF
jgi:hypothetical protein